MTVYTIQMTLMLAMCRMNAAQPKFAFKFNQWNHNFGTICWWWHRGNDERVKKRREKSPKAIASRTSARAIIRRLLEKAIIKTVNLPSDSLIIFIVEIVVTFAINFGKVSLVPHIHNKIHADSLYLSLSLLFSLPLALALSALPTSSILIAFFHPLFEITEQNSTLVNTFCFIWFSCSFESLANSLPYIWPQNSFFNAIHLKDTSNFSSVRCYSIFHANVRSIRLDIMYIIARDLLI